MHRYFLSRNRKPFFMPVFPIIFTETLDALNFYIHVINFVAWGLLMVRLMGMKRSDGGRRWRRGRKEGGRI